MDAMGVLIDTNTNLAAENSSRRVREEKRLDRKNYKSPRRFSGRSISRERRKSGKSHETAEKTIDIQESDQPDASVTQVYLHLCFVSLSSQTNLLYLVMFHLSNLYHPFD
jgi:hypothetical protein